MDAACSLANDWLYVHDISLKVGQRYFHNDSIMITPYCIYLFKTKSYKGKFTINNNRWYSSSNEEIESPIAQLLRNESLIRPFLQKHRLTPQI
ncbi:nuclease-related domain-containing protein [Alkalihalobacillus alcalophilus]|uniref:nuclease-related domain-containing protein n=1 Tax=Alkalihalobacillus alcalophilus TaxID=1445 RepID=UPI0009DEDBD4